MITNGAPGDSVQPTPDTSATARMWAALEPVEVDLFEVYSAGPDSPTEAEFAEYEIELGFRLPNDFRNLSMSTVGGVYVCARDEVWPEGAEGDVGPAWTFLRGLMVFGISSEMPDWLDLRVRLREARERGLTSFAPIFKLIGSSEVFGYDESGTLVTDDGFGAVSRNNEQDFVQLYAREVAALLERQRRMAALIEP